MKKLLLTLLFASPLIAMEQKSSSTDHQKEKTHKKSSLTEYQKQKLELLKKQVRIKEEKLELKKINLHIKQLHLLSNHLEGLPPEAKAYLTINAQELFDYKNEQLSDETYKKIQQAISEHPTISIESEDSIIPPCGVHWNEQYNVQGNNNNQ